MLPFNFTKTAGTLAIITAVLWPIIVVSWWIAGILEAVGSIDPNASAAVLAIGYISFQLAGIFLSIIMISLLRPSFSHLGCSDWKFGSETLYNVQE